MKRTAPCYEVAKSQRVRVLDVVLLGPGRSPPAPGESEADELHPLDL